MNLGYDIAQALPGLRAEAESRMTDTCTVTRGDGGEVLDPVTDEWVPVPAVTVYSGACRVKHATTGAAQVGTGSQLLAVSQLELHVPVTAVGIGVGDRVEITGSSTRAEQVGRVFTVTAEFDGSQTTALRFRVEVADPRPGGG